jgi:uncharacterized membrane protein (UPF0136 family)
MKFVPWVVLVYSFLILGGGIVGFTISHSWPSIIMGSISALLLICSAIAMFNNSVLGYFTAAGVTLLLTIFFTTRFMHSYKFMPGGCMAILSFLVLVFLVIAKLKS